MACLSVRPVSPGHNYTGTLVEELFFESYEQIIFKKLSKTSLDSYSREAPGTTKRPTPTALSACLTQQDTLFYHLPETV